MPLTALTTRSLHMSATPIPGGHAAGVIITQDGAITTSVGAPVVSWDDVTVTLSDTAGGRWRLRIPEWGVDVLADALADARTRVTRSHAQGRCWDCGAPIPAADIVCGQCAAMDWPRGGTR